MASNADSSKASELRRKGNELYRCGDVLNALHLYQEAASFAESSDPLPFSNLSAAYYELGNYKESIDSAENALRRAEAQSEDFKQKVSLRFRQSELQLTCRHIVTHASASGAQWGRQPKRAWRKIIDDVPCFKPPL